MTRRRSLSLGLAAATAVLLTSCDAGDEDERRSGFWFDERPPITADDLGALGYAPGYELPDTDWTGLRVHDPERAVLAPFVLSSGHEPAAYVLQPDGTLERRWALAEDDPLAPEIPHPTQRPWRRVVPLPDGDLLAIHEGVCLLRLDADSNIVWRGAPGAHHDLHVAGDAVWVLDRTVGVLAPETGGEPSDDDPLIVVDGLAQIALEDGAVRDRLVLPDLVVTSEWSEVHDQAVAQARSIDVPDPGASRGMRAALDPYHSNAVLALPGEDDQLVVFLRDVGALAQVDLGRGVLASLKLGPWQGAHDPQIRAEEPGRLVLFDNHGRADPAAPASRIVAIDRESFETTVVFEDTPPTRFYSPVCGALTPLPGGVWLVVESTAGRAFQIDASGEIVWEFRSPFRVEGEGLVAVLLDLRPL